MSECRHKNIDPYDCFCQDCGKQFYEVVDSMQARIDVLTADNKDLRDACLQKQEIINSFNEVDKARSAQCWRLQAKMRALENTVRAFVDADQNNNEEVDAAFDALAALLEAEK